MPKPVTRKSTSVQHSLRKRQGQLQANRDAVNAPSWTGGAVTTGQPRRTSRRRSR